MMISYALAQMITALTADMPIDTAQKLAEVCLGYPVARPNHALRSSLHQLVGHESTRRQIDELLVALEDEQVSPHMIGYALLTAAQMSHRLRNEQAVSLLWTGPDSKQIPVRRNEQALVEVIHAAEQELHLVSYVAYKADGVREALEAAVGRGVVVHLYLETIDKDGRESFDGLRWLGHELAGACQVYEWPREMRRQTAAGKTGALHAKLALADTSKLFISSANLTGYAMEYNMEMGVMFEGGEEPAVVRKHLQSLVDQGVLALIPNFQQNL